MTAKELAALLNGREYGKEITKEEEAAAKEAGLVVVFGQSDDLMEFRGAIDGKVDCWKGGTAYVNENGLLEMPGCQENCENCEFIKNERDKYNTIFALWNKDDFAWSYHTEIPHETFEIFDDGEKYCQGIVFSLADLETPGKWSAEEIERMLNVLSGVTVTSNLEYKAKQKLIEFVAYMAEVTNHAG